MVVILMLLRDLIKCVSIIPVLFYVHTYMMMNE